MKELGTNVTEASTASLNRWLDEAAEFKAFYDLHELFSKVLIAGDSGHFSQCPWLQKPNEADTQMYQQNMKTYESLWHRALTIQKCGIA